MNEDAIIAELLPLFRDSAKSLLTQANRQLLILEAPELPDAIRAETTDDLLRQLHTIKGDAGSMGQTRIETLMHDLESDLKAARTPAGIPPSHERYAHWFAALDLVQEMAEAGDDLPEFVPRLAAWKNAEAPEAAPEPEPATASAPAVPGPEGPTPAQQRRRDDVVRVATRRLESLTVNVSELMSSRILHEQAVQSLQARVQELVDELGRRDKDRRRFLTLLSHSYREAGLARETYLELRDHYRGHEGDNRRLKRDGHELLVRLDRLHKELRQSGSVMRTQEEDLRRLSMTPVEELFSSFHRLVRDTARELGKTVDFRTEGGQVELDRLIVQRLREPLVHLLRNALDHGLEAADERRSAGKAPAGTLTLRAFAGAGEVVIEVEDDGRGLDTERVRRTAVERGLISEQEAAAMTERAIQTLVFNAGFSTREQASRMSGRGVGLDAVTAWVGEVRGRLEWESRPGAGLLVRLRLPLTMAAIQALITRVSGQKFAVPLSAVDRVIHVRREDLRQVEGRTSIIHQGQPVELIVLARLLGMTHDGDRQDDLAVIISYGPTGPIGWVVDEFLGEQEIVIKGFTRWLAKVNNVAGAAVIGNGEIALVLNPVDLHRSAAGDARLRVQGPGGGQGPGRKKRVLVADDSLITRTMENRILSRAGFEVVEAADGLEAMEKLLKQPFDLVVSDVQMPRMSGLELTRKIRSTRSLEHLPVIVVSFLDAEEQRMSGLEAGANAYLTKSSFNQARLLELVEQLIGA